MRGDINEGEALERVHSRRGRRRVLAHPLPETGIFSIKILASRHTFFFIASLTSFFQ